MVKEKQLKPLSRKLQIIKKINEYKENQIIGVKKYDTKGLKLIKNKLEK